MDELRIQIVTYNVAVRNPEGSVRDILGLDNVHDNKTPLPDFFLIGLQEVKAQPQNYLIDSLFNDPWTNSFKDVLAGLGYVKAKTVRLVGIIMSVFCLRKHVVHLRDMQSLCTRTGLKGLWGNKGGVSLRLQIYGCSICFVNCHLAAHDHLLQERISDYNNILANQKFDCRESVSIMFHDYVFWFGDLNFRLNQPGPLSSLEIDKRVKAKDFKSLLEHDQLKIVMSSGDAFSELSESHIDFPPTYKYNFRTSEYDLSRRPGWTDRILYKVNPNVYENVTLDITPQSYKAIESVMYSDHKPVVASFAIKVFSDYVERCVKFLPIQTWYINEPNTAIVVMGSDVNPNVWDWIGVYYDDFAGLDEYLGFIYMSNNNTTIDATGTALPTIVRSGDRVELKFFENIVRVPRKYRLIYFSHDSGSVLGMSHSFLLRHRDPSDTTTPPLDW
uniref:Phosphatidylinositol 4,5-bisphosphate 5-phosphatase A n=1 Tax=Lygus hesperus TaxID=30085 RepID=A0A0A9YBR6_LYGHE